MKENNLQITSNAFLPNLSNDAVDFLEALLWVLPDENLEELEEAMPNYSIYDFDALFISCLEEFISGFRNYLEEKGLTNLLDFCESSFGGNIYFSLSGHGCGFFDESFDDADKLQKAVEDYSGNKYRFEEIDLMARDDGKISLGFLPEFLEQRTRKLFEIDKTKKIF